MSEREKLARLATALVEDILSMTDAEIMAEAIEDYGSVEAARTEAQRIQDTVDGMLKKQRGDG